MLKRTLAATALLCANTSILLAWSPEGSPITELVIDRNDTGYEESAGWSVSANGGYNGESLYAFAGTGSPDLEDVVYSDGTSGNDLEYTAWEIDPSLECGKTYTFEVYATWVSGSNRTSDATYHVYHDAGIDSITVDQTQNGGQWNYLGTYTMSRSESACVFNSEFTPRDQVRLYSDFSNGTVISSDAVRYVLVEEIDGSDDSIVVDNSDASSSSNWFTSTQVTGYLQENYAARSTAFASDPMTFTAFVPTAGNYEVFARWTDGSNRASAAPYIINHSGGSTTVFADQTTNGGTWVSLGTFNFASGNTDILLSCWTNSGAYVIGDGIKLEAE